MSVDIDWTLLSEPSAAGEALADGLVSALNAQLNTASRPSFLGPVTVSAFDFGTAGPSVEIKDVRDVWRAFDDGDDEGDAEVAARNPPNPDHYPYDEYDDDSDAAAGGMYSPPLSAPMHAVAAAPPLPAPVALHATRRPRPTLPAGVATASTRRFSGMSMSASIANDDDERESVYSGLGSRSVASVGLGMGALVARRPFGSPHRPSRPASRAPSLAGGPRLITASGGGGGFGDDAVPPDLRDLHHLQRGREPTGTERTNARVHGSAPPPSSPPPSPPARPAGLGPDAERTSSLPPVQIHLRVEHAANLSLTLHTSLQVNYPSSLFMALPLKLVITGMTLAADVVVAYSSRKNRVHFTIVDMGDDGAVANGTGTGGGAAAGPPGSSPTPPPDKPPPTPTPYAYNAPHQPVPIGQRILPHLHIESEIGHADTHVLRNVGKVERFIVDVVRKTLVDELVFPNFHTIAL